MAREGLMVDLDFASGDHGRGKFLSISTFELGRLPGIGRPTAAQDAIVFVIQHRAEELRLFLAQTLDLAPAVVGKRHEHVDLAALSLDENPEVAGVVFHSPDQSDREIRRETTHAQTDRSMLAGYRLVDAGPTGNRLRQRFGLLAHRFATPLNHDAVVLLLSVAQLADGQTAQDDCDLDETHGPPAEGAVPRKAIQVAEIAPFRQLIHCRSLSSCLS